MIVFCFQNEMARCNTKKGGTNGRKQDPGGVTTGANAARGSDLESGALGARSWTTTRQAAGLVVGAGKETGTAARQ